MPFVHEQKAGRNPMSNIVATPAQVIANIKRFPSELDKSVDLQSRLAYARAWYAHRHENGDWHFGPSKFIGYRNMTAAEYLNEDPRDGRQTERKLATWFAELDEDDPLHDELSDQLTTFLAKYGKAPSTATRISVATDVYDGQRPSGDDDRELADLLIVVARKLSRAERIRVRDAL
jgi:hypothetical protein